MNNSEQLVPRERWCDAGRHTAPLCRFMDGHQSVVSHSKTLQSKCFSLGCSQNLPDCSASKRKAAASLGKGMLCAKDLGHPSTMIQHSDLFPVPLFTTCHPEEGLQVSCEFCTYLVRLTSDEEGSRHMLSLSDSVCPSKSLMRLISHPTG